MSVSSPSTFSDSLFISRTFCYLKRLASLTVECLCTERCLLNEPSVTFSFSRSTTKATVGGKVSETFLRYQIVLLRLKLHIYLSVTSATANVEMSSL